MAAVESPIDNPSFQLQRPVGSELTHSAYEWNQVEDSTDNKEKDVEKPKEGGNSARFNQIVENKNSSGSVLPSRSVKSEDNPVAAEQNGDEKIHELKMPLNDVTIQTNNGPKTSLPLQERQTLDVSEISAEKDEESSEKNPEAKNIHNSYPTIPTKSSPKLKASGFSSSSAAETGKESSKKDAKKTRSLCCFGSHDTEQHPAPVPAKQIVPKTMGKSILAKKNNQPPQPNYAPPPLPAPTEPPPHVPKPIRDAPLVPSAQWTPEASDDGTSYEEAVQKFHPQENGSETDRDSDLLKDEEQVVETLTKPIYNKKYHYEKTAFQGDEKQDELWRKWVDDDFKNLRELQNIIMNTKGLGLASLAEPRYLEFVKVRRKGLGIVEQEQEWKSTLLICFLEQKEVDKFNKQLKNFDTKTWFLKDFTVQVEVRVVEPCAVGSDAGIPGQSPIGTPIFSQTLQSASTLCGMTCHIRGSDTSAESFCTIGGVLHINKKFFVLTSAHPFQDKIGNAREIDATFDTQIGRLFSYKFGEPEDKGSNKIRLVSDWALILLENQYVRPNTISLEGSRLSIPISGFLLTKELTMGKVWVCSSRGAQLGVLAINPTIISMAGTFLKTRSIRLEKELVDGDSGSWVVRSGKLCGFIISRAIGETWAYMLPIEQVFEDIHESLESIWKGEVSTPLTWLEASLPKPIPQNHLPGLDHDDGILVHNNEEKKPESLQEKASISAQSDEKVTDPPTAEAKTHLVSEFPSSEGSVPVNIPSTHAEEVDSQQKSVEESSVLEQEPPVSSSPSYVPASIEPVERVILKPQVDSDSREPLPPTNQNQKPESTKESAVDKTGDKNSRFDKNEKKEEGKGVGEEEQEQERKDKQKPEQEKKQEKEQKEKQDTKQEEKKEVKEQKEHKEPDNQHRSREESVINDQVQPSLPVDDNLLWRDLPPRVRYYLDNPDLISTPMSRVSELLRYDSISYRPLITRINNKTQTFNLKDGDNGSEVADQNIRVNETIRDIVIEATIFNDLMSQLLETITSINITTQKPEIKKTWWNNPKWRENLVTSANPTKVELILDIVMDEIGLVEKAFRLQRLFRLSIFGASILKLFVARPILKELASNNQRLKRLVEGRPSAINYYDQSIHHSAPGKLSDKDDQSIHHSALEKLPKKNIGMIYDCTKYLELYTALGEVRARSERSVGLAVPKLRASENGDDLSAAPEFILLRRDNEYGQDERSETLEDYRPYQWWIMEPKPDGETTEKAGKPKDILYGHHKFVSSIRGIDDSIYYVLFKPIRKDERLQVMTFRKMFRKEDPSLFPRRRILQMALNLSVGVILLSPTPWYQDDSDRLLKNVLLSHTKIVFVPNLVSSYKGRAYETRSSHSLLFRLCQALIEIALGEEIEDPSGGWDSYIPKVSNLHDILESRLNSGFIALKMGVEYQNIVKVCLYGIYENSSGVINIDESLPSFQEHAHEAIVEPLRALWIKAEEKSQTKPGQETPDPKRAAAGNTDREKDEIELID